VEHARPSTLQIVLMAIGLGLLIWAPLNFSPQSYEVRVMCLVLLFASLGVAWNFLGGLANRVSLGHAAFFGIGAYASTILQRTFDLSPWIGMLVGMVIAALFALLLSIPTFRLRGHYFALATLAAGEAMRVLANSWASLTEGPVGISVPFRMEDSLWMLQFRDVTPYYYVFLAVFVLVTALFWWVKASALGYRLRAVKENEEAAEVIGVDTYRAKLIALLISAVITAGLGTMYAQFQFFFDPDTVFGIAAISVRMALIAILGGVGTVFGPLIGAAFIIPLEELANTWFGGEAAGLSAFTYGVVLIVIILINPRGLIALFRDGFARLRGGRKEAAA